jgi:hypothetical protein
MREGSSDYSLLLESNRAKSVSAIVALNPSPGNLPNSNGKGNLVTDPDEIDDILDELDKLPTRQPRRMLGSFIDNDDYYETFPEDEAYDKVGNDDPFDPFGW